MSRDLSGTPTAYVKKYKGFCAEEVKSCFFFSFNRKLNELVRSCAHLPALQVIYVLYVSKY